MVCAADVLMAPGAVMLRSAAPVPIKVPPTKSRRVTPLAMAMPESLREGSSAFRNSPFESRSLELLTPLSHSFNLRTAAPPACELTTPDRQRATDPPARVEPAHAIIPSQLTWKKEYSVFVALVNAVSACYSGWRPATGRFRYPMLDAPCALRSAHPNTDHTTRAPAPCGSRGRRNSYFFDQAAPVSVSAASRRKRR